MDKSDSYLQKKGCVIEKNLLDSGSNYYPVSCRWGAWKPSAIGPSSQHFAVNPEADQPVNLTISHRSNLTPDRWANNRTNRPDVHAIYSGDDQHRNGNSNDAYKICSIGLEQPGDALL